LEGERKKPWNPNSMKKKMNSATGGGGGEALEYRACGEGLPACPDGALTMKCHKADLLYGHPFRKGALERRN
jgi:hypothetical protein